MDKKGVIFDIQRFSVHDGPGIRTVVFLKGCPLRCIWCHNPESQKMELELFFEEELCSLCGKCIRVCPQSVHEIIDSKRVIKREFCVKCGKCVEACLPAALTFKGRTVTVKEVVDEVLRDNEYYSKSDGGITLSGGEPLAQPAFTKDLLVYSKSCNLNTAIETCGFADWQIFEDILNYVDLVIYDIKIYDSVLHKAHCGIENSLILQNLKGAVVGGKSVLVRIPLIPQITETEDNLKQIGAFLSGLGIKCAELIPYHAFSKDKCKALGREYNLNHIKTQTPEELEHTKQQFSCFGLATRLSI